MICRDRFLLSKRSIHRRYWPSEIYRRSVWKSESLDCRCSMANESCGLDRFGLTTNSPLVLRLLIISSNLSRLAIKFKAKMREVIHRLDGYGKMIGLLTQIEPLTKKVWSIHFAVHFISLLYSQVLNIVSIKLWVVGHPRKKFSIWIVDVDGIEREFLRTNKSPMRKK